MSQRKSSRCHCTVLLVALTLYPSSGVAFLTTRITQAHGTEGKMKSRRVLFPVVAVPSEGSYLGHLLPDASSGSKAVEPVKDQHGSFDLAPQPGLPSQRLSTLLVLLHPCKPFSFWLIAHWRYVSVALSSRLLGYQVWSFGRTFLRPAALTDLQPPCAYSLLVQFGRVWRLPLVATMESSLIVENSPSAARRR